jgi:hypothetical protein
MSVANNALAAVRKSWVGDQPTSDASQSFCDRIIDFVFLSERDNSSFVPGVSVFLGGSGGLVTNPFTSLLHPVTQFPG